MADRNAERGPSREDRSRMDEIRAAQNRASGDPRITGERGSSGRPYHVVIDDASDKFFDSFRAPTPEQGPQRPSEGDGPGRGTGEELFRAGIEGSRALAEAAHRSAMELRASASMFGQWTADMGRWTDMFRENQEAERVRVDTVLTRLEQHYERVAAESEGGPGGGRRRRGGEPPAGPTPSPDEPPIPDLDNPNPDGSFPPVPPTPPPGPPAPPPGPGGRGGGGSGGGTPQGPPVPPPHDDRYARLDTHIATARREHRGGVRRQVTRAAAEDLHQRMGQGTERENTIIPVHDEDGELSHFEERDAEGNLVRSAVAESEEGQSMARTALRMATISRMAGSLAAGRGLGGMALGGLRGLAGAAGGGVGAAAGGRLGAAAGSLARVGSRALPVVGWGLAATDVAGEVFRFAQDQRAKNAYYQSIYGGANTEGFGQRLQEEGFAWSQFLTTGLDDAKSRQLFKGVSGMGFRDSQRADMIDFAQKQYKNLGMSVEQSLAAIQIAASGSNSSLVGLEQALGRVTSAARETGQSAEVMRGKFLESFAAATGAGYGVQSAAVAGIVTTEGPGASRALQNVDYSGMFSETQQRVMAAQQGISYGQQIYNNATGNIVPGLEARDQMIGGFIGAVLTPQMKRYLDDAIQQEGGPEKVKENTGTQHRLGLELLRQGLDPGMVKVAADAMVGPGALTNVPDDAVGEWVVRQYVGAGDLSEAAEKDQAAKNERALTPEDRVEGGLFSPGGGQSKFVQENTPEDLDLLFSGAARSKDSVVGAYAERQSETGMTDPAMEAFIKATGDYSEVGVEVQTKDGPKVVGKDEAIRYYGDQIAKGTAKIVGGPQDIDGRTVGELTGVTQKDYTAAGGRDTDTTDDAAAEQAPGVSTEEWKASHESSYDDAAGQGGGGKYTIELSDEARRFFNLAPPAAQNAQVEAGAGAGLPPKIGGR